MNVQEMIRILRAQGLAISALVRGLTADQARWKPTPESWSVLEVLNHLVDEEIYDFRARVNHILYTPDQDWPEIDPGGWVTQRHYNEQDLDETLIRFEAEREKSLTWLADLGALDLNRTITWDWGTLSAGDFLASWLAHDLLHLRQLVELRYQITSAGCQPYQVDYAGKWS